MKAAFVTFTLGLAMSAQAQVDVYYSPEPVGDMSVNRVFYDDNTHDRMYYNASGQADNNCGGSYNTPLSAWNLAAFTGVLAPQPLGPYQRGCTSYGGSAVGMFDYAYGNGTFEPIFSTMLNSGSTPYNSGAPLSGTYLSYWFSASNKPFYKGVASVLRYSAMVQVPQAYAASGGQAQLNMGMTFEDTTTGKYVIDHEPVTR